MKQIIVPKDMESQELLNFDEAPEERLFSLILNSEDFYFLLNNGFFEQLNHMANTNIDDFEDESIIDMKVIESVLESELFDSIVCNDEIKTILEDIKKLFQEAIKRNTGIYFYF